MIPHLLANKEIQTVPDEPTGLMIRIVLLCTKKYICGDSLYENDLAMSSRIIDSRIIDTRMIGRRVFSCNFKFTCASPNPHHQLCHTIMVS